MKDNFYKILRWSEKYTETDMVYATQGSFWILLGKLGIFAVAFVKMIFFGRFLPSEAYGTYTFILSMAAILGIFSLPGVNISLVKAIAQKKEGTLKASVKERLKFSLLGSLASIIASGWYLFNENYPLSIAFLIVALILPTQSVFSTFPFFWMGRKNFEKSSKYEFLSVFLVALITVPAIILTDNPILIVAILFLSQSIFNGILLLKTFKERKNDDVLDESIGFGKSLTIMNAIEAFANQIDKIIVWKFFGAVPLAIYSFAQLPIQKIESALPIIPLALPKMGEKSVLGIKEGISSKFKKLFLLFVPLTIFIFLIAPFFYKIVLPQYVDSVPYFQGFSLLLLFAPFLLFNASLVSEMRKRELYIIQTVSPIIKIVLFLILIPFFHIWGVVVAIVISKAVESFLALYYFNKI